LDWSKPSFKTIRRNTTLFALILALAAAAAYLPLWKQKTALNELDLAAEALRSDAKKAEDLNLSLQSRIRNAQELMEERRSSRPIVDILLELTNLHSDASWVRFLKITDVEIVLRGETRDSATLVQRLERSPMFEGVELRGPIVRSKGTFFERYRLGMRLAEAGRR